MYPGTKNGDATGGFPIIRRTKSSPVGFQHGFRKDSRRGNTHSGSGKDRRLNLILPSTLVNQGRRSAVFSIQQKNLLPCRRRIGTPFNTIWNALRTARKVFAPRTDVIAPILVSFLMDSSCSSTLKSQ